MLADSPPTPGTSAQAPAGLLTEKLTEKQFKINQN